MPLKTKKACSVPGCPNIGDHGKCDYHYRKAQKEYAASRESTTERGYGGTWPRVRMMKLREYPLCERCAQVQRITSATLVHHKDRNSKNNLESNLESLCVNCHDEEHKHERWKQK